MPSFQPVKKASQNLPPMAAKKVKIVFCRGAKGVRAGGCKKLSKSPKGDF